MARVTGWQEVGDRVFVRRYPFYDQNIGAVLGADEALIVDTRSTYPQAREILADLRELTAAPVTVVVDTHGHFDHVYGNRIFRPATIWGHAGCVTFMARTGEQRRANIAATEPELAADLPEVVIDPPDRTFTETAYVAVGERRVELRFLGRGHTDHDIVIKVPGAGVLFAGDLVENGNVPYFGDGYPIDWPETAYRVAELTDHVVVPGHGAHADRRFVESQADALASLADLARQVEAGRLTLDEAVAMTPFPDYPAEQIRRPLERALQQLRGELT
jgi:glyoxylase-like metal-dependent hydrolase (beta-lactamase superfamily II)